MRQSGTSTRVTPVAKYVFAVLLIATLSALQDSYQYGNGNQVFQLPKVHQLIEPELFPEDALVDSLRNYPSAAYPAIAWTASAFDVEVEALYLVLWAGVRLSLVALIMLIASRFVHDFPGLVFVTLAACTTQWAIRRTAIGGEHIMTQHLTHTELAFTLQLGALAAWLYRRPILAGALIGAAVHVNAMTTVHVSGFMLLLWALDEDRFHRRNLWALIVAAAIAAPHGLEIYGAMSGSTGAAAETERFWELLRIRNAPHYFIHVLSIAVLISISTVFALISRERNTPKPLRRMMFAALIYTSAMFVMATVGVHLSSSKLVVLLHPLRGDKMLHLVFVLAVPVFIWLNASKERTGAGAPLLAPITAAFMLGYTPPGVALIMLPALLGLWTHWRDKQKIGGLDARGFAVGGIALVALGLLALPHTTLYAVTLFAAGIAGAVIAICRRPEPAVLAFVTLISLGLMMRGLGLPQERPEWYRAGEDPSFVQAAEWAARETCPSARFITPVWMEGWRCLSMRGTLAQYRDLSAKHWDVGFEEGFWERLEALNGAVYFGPDLAQRLRTQYLQLHPEQLLVASETYSIDYVVMPVEWLYGEGLKPIYCNESYQVFPIEAFRQAYGEDRG